MSIFNDKFKRVRLDQSPYLFHFINSDDTNPLKTLQKILEEKKLISEKRSYICFSASPVTAITKFFETPIQRTGRPLYQPWGIGFSRDRLVRDFNARNVIYTDGNENIPEDLAWRTDMLNVDSYDFEYLKEWRIKGKVFDFSQIPKEDIIVIAPTIDALNSVVIKYDMEFAPYVNYTGDIIENWDESFTREWKGISVDTLGVIYLDDYAISSGTISQILGEDMLEKIFATWPINLAQRINNERYLFLKIFS